jgi:hypothetical protein
VDIPQSVIRPEVPDHLLGYFDIFWTLDTCRTIGMCQGRIPWTAIDAFAERNGYTDDDILYEDLVYIILEMDKAYCRAVNAASANTKEAGGHGSAEARSKMSDPDW